MRTKTALPEPSMISDLKNNSDTKTDLSRTGISRFGYLGSAYLTQITSTRGGLVKLAIATLALSKVVSLCLQTVAIPLIYHSLGQHGFELFLLLTAALATLTLAQMGAGPGLTQGIATARATSDTNEEASLFGAALQLALFAALAGSTALLLSVHFVPPAKLWGQAFVNDQREILAAAEICVFILAAQIITGVAESALAGYQEQAFTNAGRMAANILSLASLIFVFRLKPTIITAIAVMYGIPTLAQAANLFVLMRRRPYLREKILQLNRHSYKLILNTGASFWAIQLSGIVEQQGGIVMLAHVASTRDTALFGAVYRVFSMVSGVVTIATQPLWPAFANAMAVGDVRWINRSYRTIRRAMTAYSVAAALTLATMGPWIFVRLLHIDTHGSYALLLILSVYLVANIWTHLFYITLMGMRAMWKVASIVAAENLILIIAGVILAPRWGSEGMATAYLIASLSLPAWLLPLVMASSMSKLNRPAASLA